MKLSKVYLDRLNDIQKEFVLNDENKNVLVSASAGTGKTTSMISKLVYLIIEKKIKLKELLVVTYTKSAANEMKQKLFKLLTSALNDIDDLEERNRISDELDDLMDEESITYTHKIKGLVRAIKEMLREIGEQTLYEALEAIRDLNMQLKTVKLQQETNEVEKTFRW